MVRVGRTYTIKSPHALYSGKVKITRIDTLGEIWAILSDGMEVRIEESWLR